MSERRRRVPRLEAVWPGRYVFKDDPSSAWRECRILDLSVLGARLEIFESVPGDLVGREITVEFQTPGAAKVSRMMAVIRNVGSGSEGGIAVGIQFGELSWSDRALLDSYDRMRIFW
jgi:hypothetical protein